MKIPFKIDLKGKTVAITGGGGVLCGGFAEALAACGANVALLDINEAAANAAAEKVKSEGGKAVGVVADALNRDSLEAAREKVLSIYGKCDILINGAGGNSPKGTTEAEYYRTNGVKDETKSFFDLKKDDVGFVLNINFMTAFLTSQVFARDMAEAGKGCIINVSSMNSFKPLTKIPAYSAAKASVSNFTQWLAVYFASSGIRVNAIAPGFFSTTQNHALLFDADNKPTERTAKILAHTPMGRFGVPEDLTGTLLWLADEGASGFVTGVVIPVDGGFSAYSGV